MQTSLSDAMRSGGVIDVDARGLMPLDEARTLVRGAETFERGAPLFVNGIHCFESDRMWAALLSLEDVDEFIREASRLNWQFNPRGAENVDPLVRYGPAILPWLRRFVRDRVLVNQPSCVLPCLRHIGGQEVFDLLWSVHTVTSNPAAIAPVEADMTANLAVVTWLWAEPAPRFPLLALRAAAGDARATLMLMSLAQTAPSEIFGYVSAALGAERARSVFEAAHAPTEVDARTILAVLDGGASQPGSWPVFDTEEPEEAYLAMRLIAARARKGDGWWIIFERIEGCGEDHARVRPFIHGVGGSGWDQDACRPLGVFEDRDEGRANVDSPYDLDGVIVVGPRGPISLSNDDLPALLPHQMTAPHVEDPRFTLLLRAYFQRYPTAFWIEAREAARALKLPEDIEILVVTDAWSHPTSGRPSESPALRSLAEALAARDPAKFVAEESNTDWRLHAKYPVGGH